jgi:hypothetical protein
MDTGPLLAAIDAADGDHEACAELVISSREDLVVPMLVLSELDYWCAQRLAPEVWDGFLEDLIAGAYRAEAPTTALGEEKVATLDHRHFVVRPAHTEALTLLPS